MRKKNGFGLVLAGGGGKGAYEIGVWKALLEAKGITIGAVSGTSVGALNAALFAAGDYDAAEDIWLHINTDKILTPAKYKHMEYLPEWMLLYKNILATAGIKQMGAALLIKKYLNCHSGMFSRQGLEEIIKGSGTVGKLRSAKIPCYATCYNMTEMRTQYFQLNGLPPEKVVSVLLASSAIPFVFPKENIGSAEYYDGGLPFVGENVPVRPLYEAGWREFIVVHLERTGIEEFSKYKGCKFIHIFPKNHQGGMFGTLDFHPESAKCRLDQGYKDMKSQLLMIKDLDGQLGNRDQTFDVIRTKSREYHQSMEKAGVSFDGSDDVFEELYQELSQNRSMMNDFMLKAVAAMTSADAQLDERYRKKGLENLFREFTGKNRKLQQGIDKQLIHSQRDMIKMILRMVESDAISMEVIRTLQSQLYESTHQMAKVLKSHGKEIDDLNLDFQEISREYNELVSCNQEIAGEIDRIYSLIQNRSEKNDEILQDINAQIDGMKDVERLQNWRINLKYRQFSGKDYRDLDIVGKIICVVSDFFYLTNGVWSDEMILFVKSGLDELKIEPYERLSFGAVIYKLMDHRYAKYLFERNGVRYILPERADGSTPLCETLIQGVYICNKLADVQEDISEQQIGHYLAEHNVSNELDLSAFDIACLLLVTLSKYHECGDGRKCLAAYREIEKRALLGNVDAMKKYTHILLENRYVEEAFKYTTILERVLTEDKELRILENEVIEKYNRLSAL